jgi:hypothetical protein
MPYEQYRRALIEQYYVHQLQSFVNGYVPGKPNVLLLPGGMGSQLMRTPYPYPKAPNVPNDVVWLDLSTFTGDARKLEIEADGKDKNAHVIAAYGPVSLAGIETPYGELDDFAHQENWNYAVFGFDWRRSLAECTGHFKRFVREFEREVQAKYGSGEKPIKNLTVVCHSMGGMVCTDALRDSNFSGSGFHAIVTIATPFYGTSTHQERYYKGIGALNFFYGAKVVTEIVASLPGPYTLMFLPKVIYNRDRTRLGLNRYPEYDPNGNVDADPYDPAMLPRWPKPVRAHQSYLGQAKSEMVRVADPIDSNIAPVFFNVRSALDPTTAVELLWNNVNGSTFDPANDPSPLAGVAGPGDGTVPAWSAWHAYSRPANRYDLQQASSHGNLLEHREVLELIKTVVRTRKLPSRPARVAKAAAVATKAKVNGVLDAAAKRAKRKQPPPKELFEAPVVRGIVNQLIAGEKPRLVRRSAGAGARSQARKRR